MKNRWHLPHIATIFFLATMVIALLSWIGRVYGIGSVQSILNPDGIRWELRNAISNYVEQPALGIVMIMFIGLGLAMYSGMFHAIANVLFSHQTITRKEKRSLVLSLLTILLYTFIVCWFTFSPFAILKSVTGTIENSPFLMGIYYIISFGIGLSGLVYGYISGRYRSDRDIIKGMGFLYVRCADYFVILFFIVQFFSSLIYSNILQSFGVSEDVINGVYNVFCYLPILQIFSMGSEKKLSKKQ